jgi:hypothetical protein
MSKADYPTIPLPRREGIGPHQAHIDLPAGTYEREMGRAPLTVPPLPFGVEWPGYVESWQGKGA